MVWLENWSQVTNWKSLGQGKHPAQHPPDLGENDAFAWDFYSKYATKFVRDYGLMPCLMNEVGFEGIDREIFVRKLAAIHRSISVIQERKKRQRNEQ